MIQRFMMMVATAALANPETFAEAPRSQRSPGEPISINTNRMRTNVLARMTVRQARLFGSGIASG
jgi:hypothetical protein